MVIAPTDLFAWAIDDGINKPTNIVPLYTFDIEGTPYTQLNTPTNVVGFYDYSISRIVVPGINLNLVKYSTYLFNADYSGVIVYNDNVEFLGLIDLANVSCIDASEDTLYIGTSNSGIYSYDIGLVASGIFNEYNVFKQNDYITDNEVRYINCSSNYVLATTESGVNRYNLLTDSWYKCESNKEVLDCWQSEDGAFYYVTRDDSNTFYNYGSVVFEIKLTGKTGPFGNQVNITFHLGEFGFSGLYFGAYNMLFMDHELNEYSFYLDTWDVFGYLNVWVYINKPDIDRLYIVLGEDIEDKSSKDDVFLFHDDFTDPESGKWDIVQESLSSTNLLFDGSINLEFLDFYNSSGSNPVFIGTSPSNPPNWNGNCTYLIKACPLFVDGSRRDVFTDNNYNEGMISFYNNRIYAHWASGSSVTYNTNVQINRWYDLAISHERDDENDSYIFKLYVDGVLVDQSSTSISTRAGTYGPEGRMVVGYNFIGLLSEFKIYDTVLTIEEINEFMNQTPEPESENLVAYYKINEINTEVIQDYSGNDRHSSYFQADWPGFFYENDKLIQRNTGGYITSTTEIPYPCTIQQRIRIVSSTGVGNKVYGCVLDSVEDGVYWYHNNNSVTFEVMYSGNKESYYKPQNSAVLGEYGILQLGLDFNRIDFDFIYIDNIRLVDNWDRSTYSSSDRKLKLFGQGFSEQDFTTNLFTTPSSCFASEGSASGAITSGNMWNVYSPDYLPFWFYDLGPTNNIVVNKIVIKQGWGGYEFGIGKISGSNDNINYTDLFYFNVGNIGGRVDEYVFMDNKEVYRYIRLDFTGDLGKNTGIETVEAYGHYSNNLHLSSIGVNFFNSSVVELDWVRVINYGSDKIHFESIEQIPEAVIKRNHVNVLYDKESDWSDYDVDYYYTVGRGASINDLFVTEGTSIYGGNVIFLATSNGIMCIEEKRGDEVNCRTKYYKKV